ncbi:MAG: hypothetical protein BWK75_06745 [Candidatus Altiarchaeales archaeon A3]|nr:MAG: hypothetical protein BWK75_06745 [Candidatus Altiarchaeales archaeon A3]
MNKCKSCMIYIEDRYGVKFIDRIRERIRENLGVNTCKCDIKATKGIGNITSKIGGLISSGKNGHECVIIIFDNDGGKKRNPNPYSKNSKEKYVDNKNIVDLKINEEKIDMVNVYLIVFENAIEKDWIEKGINQELPKDYKKYNLPKYANKIDIKFLKEKDENFKNFITIIDP